MFLSHLYIVTPVDWNDCEINSEFLAYLGQITIDHDFITFRSDT
jgi:hypothetical protein